MKQYTTIEQTAKLIELGFKPPMWRVARKFDDQSPRIAITSFGKLMTSSYENVFAYAIGELIEMLDGVNLKSLEMAVVGVYMMNFEHLQVKNSLMRSTIWLFVLKRRM